LPLKGGGGGVRKAREDWEWRGEWLGASRLHVKIACRGSCVSGELNQ
jgi:hypothetical protein